MGDNDNNTPYTIFRDNELVAKVTRRLKRPKICKLFF